MRVALAVDVTVEHRLTSFRADAAPATHIGGYPVVFPVGQGFGPAVQLAVPQGIVVAVFTCADITGSAAVPDEKGMVITLGVSHVTQCVQVVAHTVAGHVVNVQIPARRATELSPPQSLFVSFQNVVVAGIELSKIQGRGIVIEPGVAEIVAVYGVVVVPAGQI
ncbi:hypothetical protein, partial [Thiolapillus sp.]